MAASPLRPVSRTAFAVVVLAVAVALTACDAQTPVVEPSQSAATTPPSATPTDTGTPAPTPSSTPVDLTCDDLVSADVVYLYNPNFLLLDGWTPDPDTAAAAALTYEGVACRWVHESSGDTIDLSVARLDTATLEALKNQAFAESQMVPTYGGDEGYFTVVDGVGEAVVFAGDAWIVLESTYFFEPGDPLELVQSALTALG